MGKLAKILVILQFLLVLGFVFFALKTTALIDSQRGTIAALKKGAVDQSGVMTEMQSVLGSASSELSSAKAARSQTEGLLAQAQADLDRVRGELSDAESAKSKAEANLGTARQDVENAKTQAADAKAEAARAVAEAGSSAIELPKVKAERDELKVTVTDVSNQLDAMKAMVVKLENENKELRQGSVMRAPVTETSGGKADSSKQAAEIKRYKQQVSELNAEKDDLQGQLSELKKANSDKANKVADYEQTIGRLEKKISDMKATEAAAAEGDDQVVVALKKQISEHEKNALKLQSEKNTLEKRIKDQEEEISSLVSQLAKAPGGASSKGEDSKKMTALKRENKDLEDQLKEQEKMGGDLRKKLAHLEDNIGDLEKALDKKESKSASSDVAKAEHMIEALKDTLNETVQDKKKAEKELERSHAEAKTLEQQIASLEKKLQKVKGARMAAGSFAEVPETGTVAVANPSGVAALSFDGRSVPREGDLYYAHRSDGRLVGKLRVENVDKTLLFVKFTPTRMNKFISKGDTITLAKAEK